LFRLIGENNYLSIYLPEYNISEKGTRSYIYKHTIETRGNLRAKVITRVRGKFTINKYPTPNALRWVWDKLSKNCLKEQKVNISVIYNLIYSIKLNFDDLTHVPMGRGRRVKIAQSNIVYKNKS
jgi:hypothetical protein